MGLVLLPFLGGWARAQTVPVEIREVVKQSSSLIAPNFFALAIDPTGYLYVGGAVSGNVLRVAPNGIDPMGNSSCVTEILSEEKAAAQNGIIFAGPKGIAIGSDGTVYVAGTGGSGDQNDNVVSVSRDGTITELVNREKLNKRTDWNPAGVAIEEGDDGTFVYATGPAPNPGAVVRINPDRTFQQIMKLGGQGLVVDEMSTVYFAQVGRDIVYSIPDAKHVVCDDDGKNCPPLISGVDARSKIHDGSELDCDGNLVNLDGPYGVALAGGHPVRHRAE